MTNNPVVPMENFFQKLAESAEEAFFAHDINTNKITYVSPSYEKIWGRSCESLYDNPSYIVESVHHDDKEMVIEKQIGFFSGNFRTKQEYRIILPDGSFKWVKVSTFLLENEETETCTVAYIVRDISERKKLEAKWAKINEHKDIAIHTVSHDLRSPMSTIYALSTLLEMELKSNDNPYVSEYLKLIKQTCLDATHLVEDLLNISQLESETIELTKESVNLSSFVTKLYKEYKPKAKEKNICFEIDCPEEAVLVEMDKIKIKQVVDNLLLNAIKFTNENGKVRVAVAVKPDFVQLKISDTGVGIPKDLLPIIFDKFTKAKRKGTKGEKSIGLGMSIVKKIVDMHQWRIRIESEENKGTVMKIEIPVTVQPIILSPSKNAQVYNA